MRLAAARAAGADPQVGKAADADRAGIEPPRTAALVGW